MSKIKTDLQKHVDGGAFATREQLLEHINKLNLFLTRNGRDYIGMKDQNGAHFRIRFDRAPNLMKAWTAADDRKAKRRKAYKNKSRYVYLLLAVTPTGSRCGYVGSAVNILGRLKKHAAKPYPNRTSWELHQWANSKNVLIDVRIVEHVDDHRLGFLLEGLWTKTLDRMGVHLPAVERWYPKRNKAEALLKNLGDIWVPHASYLTQVQPLLGVARNELELVVPEEHSPLYVVAQRLMQIYTDTQS